MSMSPSLSQLVDQAWHHHAQDRCADNPAVARLRSWPDGDDLAQGLAATFEGRRQLWLNHTPGYEAALQEARLRLERLWPQPHPERALPSDRDVRALALACDDLASQWLHRHNRCDEVVAHLLPWLAQLDEGVHPVQKVTLLTRTAAASERLRQPETALRYHFEAIHAAREVAIPTLLATSLASLGGYQASLLDHQGALEHCREAWALCADSAHWGAIHVAGINLMMALSGTNQHAEARALADVMSAWEPHFNTYQRWVRAAFYGSIYQRAGELDLAQHWLDQSLPLCADPAHPPCEWVWAQAAVWTDRGRAADAWALLEQLRLHDPEGFEGVTFPADACRLHDEAARAREALGDLAGALHHQRRAAALAEQSHRRAADAQRLALSIRLDLARLADQRDQALRERERLATLNAALARADEAKTRFLAAASHDLRQPLHALALQAAVLARELTAPRQQDLLGEMTQCVDALRHMLDSLLDLSRAESGEVRAQMAPLDLRELLLRLLAEHQPVAEARGLHLGLRVSGALPPAALSDARLLETLLRNLLGNALKYTRDGSVLLCARAGPPDPLSGLRSWRLQVRDSGIGIDAAQQQAIFEPFFQVDNPARDRRLGQGLGLAIVQRLARALAHPLSLRTAPGLGSCFELRVPGHGAHLAPQQPAAAPLPPLPRAMHVAVIDDDPANRAALAAWLRGLGCTVTDGADAREIVDQGTGRGPLDAVIADLQLAPSAGGDGLQQVQDLRAFNGQSLPALVISGDTRPATRERLIARGQRWLSKPVDLTALWQWLALAQGLDRSD
jgi:signal transduction histidine kinase